MHVKMTKTLQNIHMDNRARLLSVLFIFFKLFYVLMFIYNLFCKIDICNKLKELHTLFIL